MNALFKSFDKNNNSALDLCELKTLYNENGLQISKSEVKRMHSINEKN